MFLVGLAVPEVRVAPPPRSQKHEISFLAQQQFLLNPPCSARLSSKLRAPYRGTSLGPFVSGVNLRCQAFVARPNTATSRARPIFVRRPDNPIFFHVLVRSSSLSKKIKEAPGSQARQGIFLLGFSRFGPRGAD
jgi:hypothetical protein